MGTLCIYVAPLWYILSSAENMLHAMSSNCFFESEKSDRKFINVWI